MLLQVAKETGRVPKALWNRPVLYPDLEMYYEGFIELSGYRTGSGFGPNPIQLTDILSYCRINQLHDARLFAKFIHDADKAMLMYLSEKQAKADG